MEFCDHDSPYLVPFDGSFRIANLATGPSNPLRRKKGKKALKRVVQELADLQDVLYADNRFAVLLVFQAMDAAGKDSTIRAVTSGINPAGFQVYSFKRPSSEELDHDFLWRTSKSLPERGRIGIFNRSYYEETLVVRVHPGILSNQQLPRVDMTKVWEERYESIRSHESHLARNGTVVIKFWLNVSQKEQHRRFLRRINRPDKNWKFEAADVKESRCWPQYMEAYQSVLNATSRPWAPWYAIPADDKPTMRLIVAKVVKETLVRLGLRYPDLDDDEKAALESFRAELGASVDADV